MFVRVVVVRVFGVEEFMVVVVAVGVGAGRVCVSVNMVVGVLVIMGDDPTAGDVAVGMGVGVSVFVGVLQADGVFYHEVGGCSHDCQCQPKVPGR